MNITKIILISLLIISSCQSNLNNNSSINNNEKIKWGSSDEFPSIEFCNDLVDSNLIKDCFKKFLSNEILKNLDFSEIVIDNPVNDTIIVSILINNKGTVSISNRIISNKITSAIPNLDTLLTNAIDSLPIVLPAIKTSLGVSVNSKFQLPIILKTK